MFFNKTICGMVGLAALMAVGCTKSETPAEATSAVAPNATYVIEAEPADAKGVGEVRDSEKEDVTVVGRIGGSVEPFVDGFAAFTIVDPAVPHCAAEEGCPTPWDYCCTQNQVEDNIATVQIVDETGNVVPQDAKTLLGVKELSTVVVQGKAQRDDQGNLVVLAENVYVKE